MLVNEEGPFEIFSKLRWKLGVRYDEHSNQYGETFSGKMFSCVWCVSIWVALFVSMIALDDFNLKLFFLWWMSTSSGAIIVDRVS